ncbi:MAG: tetratricopeptide repeat protein [bacterium]|nr:tetratricopeptide repeat protein [bacterium]
MTILTNVKTKMNREMTIKGIRKYILVAAIFLVTPALYCAVPGTVEGQVTSLESGQPITGVELMAAGETPIVTDSSGRFRLAFTKRVQGDRAVLAVKQKGMEVVNRDELQIILGSARSSNLNIVLCKKGGRDKRIMEYYHIAEKKIYENYKKRKDEPGLSARCDAALALAKHLAVSFAAKPPNDMTQMYREAFKHFEAEDIGKAVQTLEDVKIETALRQASKGEARGIIDNYILKAGLCVFQLDFENYENYYRKAIKADKSNLDNVFEYADYLDKNVKLRRIIVLYKDALAVTKFKIQRAALLNRLGGTYYRNTRFQDAMLAYNEALALFREYANRNPIEYMPDVAATLNNFSVVYKMLNRLSDALAASREALAIYRKLAQKDPATYLPELGAALNNMGVLNKNLNRLNEALTFYQEALVIREKLAAGQPVTPAGRPVKYQPDLAMTLNNIGALYHMFKRSEDALKSCTRALEIYKKLSARPPYRYLAEMATTLNNRVVYYRALKRPDEALTACKQALEIRERLAGKNPAVYRSEVAATLNTLGLLYLSRGEFSQAFASLQKGLNICERLAAKDPGRYNLELCFTLISLGHLYSTQYSKSPEDVFKTKGLSLVSRALGILEQYREIPKAQGLINMANKTKEEFLNAK